MNDKLIVAKAICLLFLESLVPDRIENSANLIKEVMVHIKVPEVGLGINSEKDTIAGLKQLVSDMCNAHYQETYDASVLMQSVKIITGQDEETCGAIREMIEREYDSDKLKTVIIELRRNLYNVSKEKAAFDMIGKAYYSLKFGRDAEGNLDINEVIQKLQEQLETVTIVRDDKDPAILGEAVISNKASVNKIFSDAKNVNDSFILKTGWKAFNRMTQGGFRPQFVVINALQHSYKSGLTLSLFTQIATLNAPVNVKPGKKPALVRYSFEDPLDSNFQFIYQYLKYDETRQYVDVSAISIEEMTEYVMEKLSAMGWEVLFFRVDPTQWTYRKLIDHILKLEAGGYDIKGCMIDYLSKIPTIGCNQHGPMGTDKRDLFRRMRNFFEARGMLGITPHQLSSDVKNLLRAGIPEDQLPKELAGKGFYDGCRTLDQETDLNIIIHKFCYNRKHYLAFYCDKHRLPTIVDDEDRGFILPFPYKMPIPSDREDEDQSMKRINQAPSNVKSDILDF